MMRWHLAPRRGTGLVVVALLAALLLGAGVVLAVQSRGSLSVSQESHANVGPNVSATPAHPPVEGQRASRALPAENVEAAQLARLRALEPVSLSPAAARITGETVQQPDLYAAEFVRRLLTQDYREPRDQLVAWVQGESATTTEPLVIGKVPPELRDRLAVFSVTDSTDTDAPIPTAAQWDGLRLQHAYTTATVDRVEEPFGWTNAVASGRISDPGATARQVTATVTRRSTTSPATAVFRVSVTLNLEGPPSRRDWGLVAVISYTSIQVR